MAQPVSFEDYVTIIPSGNHGDAETFTSRWPADTNSFLPNDTTAYGGCTFALSIAAAYATVNANIHRLYSCTGTFLGRGIAGETVQFAISRVRDTRTFATRRVEVSQTIQGRKHAMATMLMDFHAPEKASLLVHSVQPAIAYAEPGKSLSEPRMLDDARKKGVPERFLKVLAGAMKARKKYFDILVPPESFGSDDYLALIPKIGRVQRDLPITEMVGGIYWKSQKEIRAHAAHVAALGFILDAGMPVVPVGFAGLDWNKVTGLASLDFAMRVFTRDVDVNQHLMREEKTTAAGEGRTFQEARLWDAKGTLVATMSQQCLLRAKEDKSKI